MAGGLMPEFQLVSSFKPTGDQPEAIKALVEGIERGDRHQVLKGATGTGKTFAIANVALVNNRPEVLDIRQMLQHFIGHRKVVIRRRTRFLLKRCRNRGHILEGLILAVSDIDEIINIIKKSPDSPTAKGSSKEEAVAKLSAYITPLP